jgi:hypothetical protein
LSDKTAICLKSGGADLDPHSYFKSHKLKIEWGPYFCDYPDYIEVPHVVPLTTFMLETEKRGSYFFALGDNHINSLGFSAYILSL